MASSWSSPFRFLEGTCKPSREDDDEDGGTRLGAEPTLAFHESTSPGGAPFLTLDGGMFGLVVGANAPDLGLDDKDAPVGRICTSSSSDEPVRSMSGIERPLLVGCERDGPAGGTQDEVGALPRFIGRDVSGWGRWRWGSCRVACLLCNECRGG
jgi:hypothetical protein